MSEYSSGLIGECGEPRRQPLRFHDAPHPCPFPLEGEGKRERGFIDRVTKGGCRTGY